MAVKGLATAFIGTIIAIPVIGQITPEDAVQHLAVGTAQAILALVAVVEFIALGFFFKMWRKDVAEGKKDAKETSELLQKLLADNSVALSRNADAGHRQSEAIEGLTESVASFSRSIDRNTEVIRKCEGRG